MRDHLDRVRPIIGLAVVFLVVKGVHLLWTTLAPVYFAGLGPAWVRPPFLHFVALLMLALFAAVFLGVLWYVVTCCPDDDGDRIATPPPRPHVFVSGAGSKVVIDGDPDLVERAREAMRREAEAEGDAARAADATAWACRPRPSPAEFRAYREGGFPFGGGDAPRGSLPPRA